MKKLLALALVLLCTIGSPGLAKNTTQHHSPIGGHILIAPMGMMTTYLLDENATIIHNWNSVFIPGLSCYWLTDSSIIRTIRTNGALGGGVQILSWDSTVEWDYRYSGLNYSSHHDVTMLPDGNILILAYEKKSRDDIIAAGRNPTTFTDPFYYDYIIEVKPTSPDTGLIVWQWHIWDHLIQDYDPTKNNYNNITNHPELLDINYDGLPVQVDDWLHVNSIDYNPALDQILLSCRNTNEIWIIDHTTTTAQATGHTGGQYGHGGDLLYRWGNPATYRAGTSEDQHFYGQHDAQWIKDGRPGSGDILVFNNGLDRPQGSYSSVEEIIPPVDQNGSYTYTPSQPYQPESPTWIYTAPNPTDFYSSKISGCQRLPDGNTLICSGMNGIFFEVTPEKNKIWEYTNPYPNALTNQVFKIQYIPPGQPRPNLDANGDFHWRLVPPGSNQTDTFTITNIGGDETRLNWRIASCPDWGNWSFSPASGQNLTPEQGPITIQVTVTAPDQRYKRFSGQITIVNQQDSTDYDVIPITLSTPYVIPHLPLLRMLFDFLTHFRNQSHHPFSYIPNLNLEFGILQVQSGNL